MLERRKASPRLRVASIAVAGFGHAAVAALLLVPALFLTSSDPQPVVVPIQYFAPAAPRLGGGGSTGAAAKATPVVAAATPKATPVFVEPKVIPDSTPEPHATATALADTGTGAAGIPEAPEGPGVPDGHPDSECLENCDENGLPGGSNPVPAHLLAIAPVAIDQPQPRYPTTARDAGIKGAVVVEIIVGVDGRVTQAKVVRGAAPFDRPTLEAVRRWRYVPVLHQGKPIVWKSTVTVRFELDGRSN